VKKDSEPVAAAVVFYVAHQIAQVIYWGDLPKFSEHKTMNFLSYSLFKYYSENGIAMIDIGSSTEDSVPNYGLCEFKESIGCDLNIKTEYFKKPTDVCCKSQRFFAAVVSHPAVYYG
jgi:lipid II:glycine glycyltransferase (peptidoglycan interpeptide bridge formation enzyme)